MAISDEFEKLWNFQHCIGTTDGTHIVVECSKLSGTQFFNYKLFFSVHDEIYPLKPWLMRPYPGSLDDTQQTFNYRLSRSRHTIENAFEVLVAIWRIFKRPIRASIETIQSVIGACICRHSYLQTTQTSSYSPQKFFGGWKVLIKQPRREIDALL